MVLYVRPAASPAVEAEPYKQYGGLVAGTEAATLAVRRVESQTEAHADSDRAKQVSAEQCSDW